MEGQWEPITAEHKVESLAAAAPLVNCMLAMATNGGASGEAVLT